MLSLNKVSRPDPSTDDSRGALELRRRMQRPQRHRLLHGYPLAAAMPRIAEDQRRDAILPEFDTRRGLLVGVLPHPFCNPAVTGCGFCTFPHEAFTSRKASYVIDHVVREIELTLRARPGLAGTADRRAVLRRRHGQSQPAGVVPWPLSRTGPGLRRLRRGGDARGRAGRLPQSPSLARGHPPRGAARPPLPAEHGDPDLRPGQAEADGPARLRRCRHVPRGR